MAIVVFFLHARGPRNDQTLHKKLKGLDMLGLILILVAFVIFLLDLQWAGTTKPWDSGTVIGTLVVCIVLTLLFIGNEIWQGDQALMTPRLLKNRIFWGCSLYVLW